MFAGNYAPDGWALCNGQVVSSSDYQALYMLIGRLYGPDRVTSFSLPDLRGRTPIHQGQGNGLSSRNIGASFGVETVSLDETQIPPHTHTALCSSKDADQSNPAGNVWAANSVGDLCYTTSAPLGMMAPSAVSLSGEGAPHENMMPYQAVSFIIALDGIYPTQGQ